jgi:hypothetical protein
VSTHEYAWAGHILHRAQALATAASSSIRNSVEHQLMWADFRQLEVLRNRSNRLQIRGEGEDEPHELIHLLLTEIPSVYIYHLEEEENLLGRPPLSGRFARRNAREEIHVLYRIMMLSHWSMTVFPELIGVVQAYEFAWAGEFEALRALHPRPGQW